MSDRYWVRENDEPWQEVDKRTFVIWERRAGLRNTMGQPNEPATGGFYQTYHPGQEDEYRLQGTLIDPSLR